MTEALSSKTSLFIHGFCGGLDGVFGEIGGGAYRVGFGVALGLRYGGF